MGFYEDWHEQQARKAAERQAMIEQAQAWVGCRVKVSSAGSYGVRALPDYGEVERVDERGRVFILVGYDRNDQPRYYVSDVALLGHTVTCVDG